MKRFIAFSFFSLLTFNAGAYVCPGQITVGKKVIDNNGRIGVVKEILNNGQISYQVPGYYLKTSSDLAPEVAECQGISKAKTAINNSDQIGKVLMVFANGKAQFERNGYYPNIVLTRNLSLQVDFFNEFSANKIAINNSNYIGKILKVFANGKVQFERNGYYPNIELAKNISLQVDSFDGLSANKIAINNRNYIGKILKVFANGKVQFERDNYYPNIELAKDISLQIDSFDGLSRGKIAINSNNHIGKILKVFANGKIQFERNGYYPNVESANDLSLQVGSLGKFSANKIAINNSDHIGKILKIFANGKIQFERNGYYPNIESANDLSLQVDSFGELTTGETAINNNNHIGKILKVFANGKIQFERNGYYPNVEFAKKLSPEVANHPIYNKKDFYANPSYQVGKVSHFFKNGKIALTPNNSVASTLYERVTEYEGYREETAVITPSMKFATVLMLFENGAAQIEWEQYQPIIDKYEMETTGVRLAFTGGDEMEEEMDQWLTEISQIIQNGDFSDFLSPTIATKIHRYEDMKDRLMARAASSNLFYSKEWNSKLVIYLQTH